jgi:hypothetical protein
MTRSASAQDDDRETGFGGSPRLHEDDPPVSGASGIVGYGIRSPRKSAKSLRLVRSTFTTTQAQTFATSSSRHRH